MNSQKESYPIMKPLNYILMLGMIVLVPVSIAAQDLSSTIGIQSKSYIKLELSKPFFKNSGTSDNNISHLSMYGYLKVGYSFSENLRFDMGIPFSHFEFVDLDGPFGGLAPHSTIGNLFVASGYKIEKTSVVLRVTLPTMLNPDYPEQWGFLTGFMADIESRDSFAEDNLALGLDLNSSIPINSNFEIRVGVGVNQWFYTGEIDGIKNQLYLSQLLQFYFNTNDIDGYFGIIGNYKVSKEPYPLALKDDITQLRTGVFKKISNFGIDLSLSSPLNYESLKYMLRLGVSYYL